MKETCLGIIRDGNFLLFIRKLRGLGAGYLTFPGGKVEEGETPEQCITREVNEEIKVNIESFRKVAEILFIHGEEGEKMHVFLITKFTGIPTKTDEAIPMWLKEPIYEEMWADDKIWLSKVLSGENVRCEFYFSTDWTEFKGGYCNSCKFT
jgi:8-oxo-dGTP diphosphatase